MVYVFQRLVKDVAIYVWFQYIFISNESDDDRSLFIIQFVLLS